MIEERWTKSKISDIAKHLAIQESRNKDALVCRCTFHFARTFKRMNDLRSSEQTISNGGTGYRFNAEGNQISYRCDVRRVTTINYDRKVIRAALGKLNQRADETSAKIDLCLVTSKVDYAPPFDVNASFAEAFEIYTENAGA